MPEALEEIAEERSPRYLKERILKICKRVSSAQMDLIRRIEELRPHLDEQDLAAFLTIECGVSKNDLPAMLAFPECLGSHEAILREKAVSLSVIKTLARTNIETRERALLRLYAGQKLDSPDIARIEQNRVRLKLGPEAYSERSRCRALVSMASRNARLQVPDFGERVDDLLCKIHDFVWKQMGFPPEDGDPEPFWRNSGPNFEAAHEELKSVARQLLADFERLYGAGHHRPGDPLPAKGNAIALAHLSLQRLADGRFGYDDGFDFKLGNPWSTALQDALEYLLPKQDDVEPGNSLAEATRRETTQAFWRPPRAIELCAGAGGQAIGLLGAGFDFAALYDSDADAVATLKRNLPWRVKRKRLQDITEDELRQYGEIDLLSGGIECTEYSRTGKRRGPAGSKNLFEEAVRILGIVKPKTFFFENVPGFKDSKFLTYRSSIFRRLKDCGYKVDFVELNANDFGVPQDRKRVLIVGVRDDMSGTFEKPAPVSYISHGVEFLQSALFPHFGQGNADYDKHVRIWLETYGSAPSLTVLASPARAYQDIREQWASRGFDLRPDPRPALTVEEMTSGSMLQPVTIEVARRLQAFPDAWKIDARTPRKSLKLIGNAFPPPVAMALGLALRKVIDGRSYSLEERLRHPIVNPDLIGLKKWPDSPLNRVTRRHCPTRPDNHEITFPDD